MKKKSKPKPQYVWFLVDPHGTVWWARGRFSEEELKIGNYASGFKARRFKLVPAPIRRKSK